MILNYRRFLPITALCCFLLHLPTHWAKAEELSAVGQEKRWTLEHLLHADAGSLPFSFVFDGQPSRLLLTTWTKRISDERLDSTRLRHTITWTDPKTGLELKSVAVEYSDFPALEWTIYFKNSGVGKTPILENIEGIDTQLSEVNADTPHLHYINGDGEVHGTSQFAPQEKALVPSSKVTFASLDGRPTDGSFPYYNLEWKDRGIIVALGWPGQWAASFESDAGGDVRVTGGQELTHMSLLPGEEIRSPRIVLLFWQGGNWIDSQNSWRRWMRAHNSPKPGGNDVPVIRAGGGFLYKKLGWGASLLDEKDQLDLIDRYRKAGLRLNTWWIDILGAGTFQKYSDEYIRESQSVVVSWDTDRARFPHGLRAISDHLETLNQNLLVWIEPEHIWEPNILFHQHPDWLLSSPDDPAIKRQVNQGVPLGDRRLLNLGDPEARDWIIDRLSRLIETEGIKVYRQDFNITPLLFWHHHDTRDRQGITENLYVQGYLHLLDALQARFPNLLIDTCASGGRRDDLETLRRAVPLWRSDQWGPDAVLQNQTYGLALWIPYFGTGTYAMDTYAYRSSLGSSLMTSWDVRDANLDVAMLRKLEAEFWRTAQLFTSDYYPLTAPSPGLTGWVAWQFNRPEHGDGMIQAFRRDQTVEATQVFQLHHLDPSGKYALTDLDTGKSFSASGGDLMKKGIPVAIHDLPGSALIVYQEQK